jgi:hypothetical protein
MPEDSRSLTIPGIVEDDGEKGAVFPLTPTLPWAEGGPRMSDSRRPNPKSSSARRKTGVGFPRDSRSAGYSAGAGVGSDAGAPLLLAAS